MNKFSTQLDGFKEKAQSVSANTKTEGQNKILPHMNLFNNNAFISVLSWPRYYHSIANSSLFPTFMYLHSNSTQILALKENGFFTFSG